MLLIIVNNSFFWSSYFEEKHKTPKLQDRKQKYQLQESISQTP